MQRIYKYEIPQLEKFPLELPSGATFLSLQVQRGTPQAWFLCDPEAEKEQRRFVIVGTGHPVPENERLNYVGTFQIYDGDLVLHVFECVG